MPPPLSTYEPIPQSADIDAEDGDLQERDGPVEDAQVDKCISWIHFIFGGAALLPWNALITATPYFLMRLNGSPLKSSFGSYLSITFTLTNFIVLAHATITLKQSSPSRRTFTSTIALAILVAFLALSTAVPATPGAFFCFVILNGIMQACSGSYLQTATIATAALFGPAAMQAILLGQAFNGVVISVVQLLSSIASVRSSMVALTLGEEYSWDTAETRTAATFFSVSTLFLLVTLGAAFMLVRMPVYKTAILTRKRHDDVVVPAADYDEPSAVLENKNQMFRILKLNAEYELAIGYVFLVTLSVFPTITAPVMPTNPSWHPLIFTATHFLIFNTGDLIGRYLCSIPKLATWSSRRLLVLSFARTLFIPLFLLCNVQRPTTTRTDGLESIGADAPLLINPDAFFFLLLLLFALSNGYVSTMGMIAAPSVKHNALLRGRGSDVDLAATVANFCLMAGLVLGSAASFAVRAQICRCNPFLE